MGSPLPESSTEPGTSCDYDYVPTEEDTTWEYDGTRGGTEDYQRTDTITESRDDGFTLTSQFSNSDVTLALEYGCTEAGLILFDPTQQLMGGAATGPDGTAVMTVLDRSGITLPSEMEAGQTWQQYLSWEVSSPDTTIHGEYTFDNTAMGLEVVTVPFGTFDAMHVETELRWRLEGEDFATCQTPTWYVKDVGLIKELFDCPLLGSHSRNVIELVSFDSP